MNNTFPLTNERVIDSGAEFQVVSISSTPDPSRGFRVAIFEDEDGGFCVQAIRHPAVISQGDTIDEAMRNIAEAFAAVREACRLAGEKMEVAEVADIPRSCRKVWIPLDD